MQRRSILVAAMLLGGTGFLIAQDPPEANAAASYGELDQELYVGMAAFRASESGISYGYEVSDGYLDPSGGGDPVFHAPLTLPAGARIHALCLYAFDQNSNAGVHATLTVNKLVPAGVSPGWVLVPGSGISTSWDFGHGVVCTDPSFSYTYRETGDIDGDGQVEHLSHRLGAYFSGDSANQVRLGGVGVIWRRQVSPAPASATFADVPTGHGFFQSVEALAASGITAGCGGGNFCPDSPLTRGQMAVFLAKALGLHWPY